MSERNLLKVKIDQDSFQVLVKYEVKRKGGTDVVTLEATERPSQDLVAALRAMAEHLIAIAELPKEWLGKLTVIGVTRTLNDETGTGIVITALRELKDLDAPLVLNSPHTTSFPMACATDLAELERLALAYVDGKERAQLELAFPGPATAAHTRN